MPDYLTASLPGTGGIIKQDPEDFFVEEIPRYLPCGEGEHLFLTVEKTGLTTWELLQRLSRKLQIPERDLGHAGLKDARAVTRQTISLPRLAKKAIENLEIPGLTVLSADYHRNKLRPGHLAGNRFRIRIRQPEPEALDRALDILQVLQDLGTPNRFGEQRYGVLGNSHLLGQAILRCDWQEAVAQLIGDPERITQPGWKRGAELFRDGATKEAAEALPGHMGEERRLLLALARGTGEKQALFELPKKRLRFYLSAFQSALFDRVVGMRLASIERLWLGDLAYLHDRGACFSVTDPGAEQPRADRLEISPTGPLYGCKVKLAGGAAGILEESLLAKEKLTLEAFRLGQGLTMDGERRPLRVPLAEPTAEPVGDDLVIGFSLPPGSFATAVLSEVMKSPFPEASS